MKNAAVVHPRNDTVPGRAARWAGRTAHRLARENTDSLAVHGFRYTIVGGVALVVDLGSLTFQTEILGIYYLVSAAIAFMLGLAVNYWLSIVWVFNRRTLGSKWAELILFSLIGVFGLALLELLMWLLTEKARLFYLSSKLIATVCVFFWNFLARRFLLFH